MPPIFGGFFVYMRLFMLRKYKSILRGFYNAVSVPGDASHTALLKSHYCLQ